MDSELPVAALTVRELSSLHSLPCCVSQCQREWTVVLLNFCILGTVGGLMTFGSLSLVVPCITMSTGIDSEFWLWARPLRLSCNSSYVVAWESGLMRVGLGRAEGVGHVKTEDSSVAWVLRCRAPNIVASCGWAQLSFANVRF